MPGQPGDAIIDSFARDDLVGSLLLLYGLHPLDIETRVHQALEKVRPYLGSHGGNVELLGVTQAGVVHLRLQGSCHGCPSSAMTLKLAIEEAIYAAAPDIVALEVEGSSSGRPRRRPALSHWSRSSARAARPMPTSGGWEQSTVWRRLAQGSCPNDRVSGRRGFVLPSWTRRSMPIAPPARRAARTWVPRAWKRQRSFALPAGSATMFCGPAAGWMSQACTLIHFRSWWSMARPRSLCPPEIR